MTLVMTPSVAVAVTPMTGVAGASFDCFAPKPGSWRHGNGAALLAAAAGAVPANAAFMSEVAVIGSAPAFYAAARTRHADPPKPRNC